MGRNFKKICEQLNIDYKKNLSALLLKIVIILIGSVVISIFVNLLMGIICAFFIFPIYLMHINNLEKKYDQLLNAKEISFYSLYRFLLNMLDNQIILYNALKECIDLIDDILKKDVSKLIEDIENDSSINPFFHFSELFESSQIKQMILSLYYCQENGNQTNILEEMNHTMVQLQDESINQSINQEIKKIEKYSIVPLLLSATTIILFSIFIFKMIGVEQFV